MRDSGSSEISAGGEPGKLRRYEKPDAIEILPGIAYKAVELIKDKVSQPIITGGLIYSQRDAVKALAAGAIGISTSARALWDF